MKNIVVFASGSGSNLQSLIDAAESGNLNAIISGLITNKKEAKALLRAKKHGIPSLVISEGEFESFEKYEEELLIKLQEWNAHLIVLAGFLRKIPPSIIKVFENRILNIHPSLLPSYGGKGFYGLNVHRAVIESGDTISGCTIHLVSEEYDKGEILDQSKVQVFENDTPEELANRILKEEHLLYPKVISNYLSKIN